MRTQLYSYCVAYAAKEILHSNLAFFLTSSFLIVLQTTVYFLLFCVIRWAIIGVTSEYIYHKVDHDHYFENVGVLQDHASRISKRLVVQILLFH